MVIISDTSRARPAVSTHCLTLRRIVVVVPAHNERDRLPGCLASIAAAAAQVEVPVTVMVVLDGCTDGSEDAIASGVRAIKVSARNVGAARAAGFVAAASTSDVGTWLATTDADSRVPTTWLADQIVHHSAMAQGMVGTVSGIGRSIPRKHSGATTGCTESARQCTGMCTGRTSGAGRRVLAGGWVPATPGW